MLEAVNSVLQTAPLVRGSTEQVSTAASYAANPTSVQKVPQAPYISPYIHLDVDLGAVLQIRDAETGDVVRQIPSEASIEAKQRFQQQIDQVAETRKTQTSADSVAVVASQASQAQPRTAQAAEAPRPQLQQQAAPKPAPQAKQIAAFHTAALSGGAGTSAGGGAVTLFA